MTKDLNKFKPSIIYKKNIKILINMHSFGDTDNATHSKRVGVDNLFVNIKF